MVTTRLPESPTYINSASFGHSKIIEPGDKITANTNYGIELTEQEMENIRNGPSWFWFYGCLNYRDFMNEKREARFCWRLISQTVNRVPIFYAFASDGDPPEAYTKNT